MEGPAEWSAIGLENRGHRKVRGSIPRPSAIRGHLAERQGIALLSRRARKGAQVRSLQCPPTRVAQRQRLLAQNEVQCRFDSDPGYHFPVV